jgi:hypothetical protein
MKKIGAILVLAAIAAVGAAAQGTTHHAAKVAVIHDLWFEEVGQFMNSGPGVTPETHIHYGYVSWVQGLSAFTADPQTLSTARLTFFADGKTTSTTADGPLRFATRTGTITIYYDPSRNSDWTNPATFRDGTPVLVVRYRHQPIQSTLTSAVSLFSHDMIVATKPFAWGKGKVRLGAAGDTFDEHYTGQGNMPGPPSGYFIGYARSG